MTGASLRDRATRPADQAPAGLGDTASVPSAWTQAEAVDLCRRIEAICPEFGCHVALTGGTLYKNGPRKDVDLLFYRIRQEPEIDQEGLWIDLENVLGLKLQRGFGWCFKLEDRHGRKIDCFFPEEQGGEYEERGEPTEKPILELDEGFF